MVCCQDHSPWLKIYISDSYCSWRDAVTGKEDKNTLERSRQWLLQSKDIQRLNAHTADTLDKTHPLFSRGHFGSSSSPAVPGESVGICLHGRMELGLWFRRPAVQGALWRSVRLRVAHRVLVALDHIHAAAISAAMFFGVSVMHTVPITEGYAVPRENLGLVLFGRDPTEHLKQPFIERRYTSSTTAERVVKAKLFYSELDFDTTWKSENSGEHPSRCPASSAATIFTRVIEQIAPVLLVRGQTRPCHPPRARVQVHTDAGHARARPSDHREIVLPRARVLAVMLGSVIQSVREGSSRAVLPWRCSGTWVRERDANIGQILNVLVVWPRSARVDHRPHCRYQCDNEAFSGAETLAWLQSPASGALGAGEVGRLGNRFLLFGASRTCIFCAYGGASECSIGGCCCWALTAFHGHVVNSIPHPYRIRTPHSSRNTAYSACLSQ